LFYLAAGSFLYMKSERNLLESLRKRTTDLEKALSERDIELAALRQNTKFSKVNEMQSQSATYLAEARRLRLLLQKSHEQLQQQMLSCQTNHPANFQLLQARADTLTTENERLTAQLASAVETAEMLMSTNQALAHEVESHASHQAALEATNAAQQRKITEQQQQLIVARNAAAKAAAAAHAAAGVAQQFAQQHGQWPQSPTANASPVSQQPAVKSPKKLVEAHADEQYE
jgi:chromosome segregation ATPase